MKIFRLLLWQKGLYFKMYNTQFQISEMGYDKIYIKKNDLTHTNLITYFCDLKNVVTSKLWSMEGVDL